MAKNESGLMIAALVAVVAIVGMVMIVKSSPTGMQVRMGANDISYYDPVDDVCDSGIYCQSLCMKDQKGNEVCTSTKSFNTLEGKDIGYNVAEKDGNRNVPSVNGITDVKTFPTDKSCDWYRVNGQAEYLCNQ